MLSLDVHFVFKHKRTVSIKLVEQMKNQLWLFWHTILFVNCMVLNIKGKTLNI